MESFQSYKIDLNFKNTFIEYSAEINNLNSSISQIDSKTSKGIHLKDFIDYLNLFKFIDSNIDIYKITKNKADFIPCSKT